MKPEHKSLIRVEGPSGGSVDAVASGMCCSPFSDSAVDFASAFSRRLLKESEAKKLPEMVALGFWMRRSNILKLREDFRLRSKYTRLPRGLAFHISPSNVDTIFIYSLFISMFCGNRNIVRLSSSPNPQVNILLRVLNDTFRDFPGVAERVILIRYDYNDEITSYLSAFCDLRIIWGGDETIRRIRALPLQPHAKEMTFSDRFSIAVIDSRAYLDANEREKERLTTAFYNDSYTFNQMACSSPRLVCWVSRNPEISKPAQSEFWQRVEACATARNPDISPASIMEKYLAMCCCAVETEGAHVTQTSGNLVSRVQLTSGNDIKRELHKGNALFLELYIEELDGLLSVLKRKDQTLTAFGFSRERLTAFIEENIPAGIDRIVPFGEALDFSPVWDGYDLLFEMTRTVSVHF